MDTHFVLGTFVAECVVPDSFPLISQAISLHFYRSRPSSFLVTPRVHNDWERA
jgi:hypothetical protein